ncbi:hypothetical protein [Candidatus Amarolinea dominans]|uniref:hypothetical protein n=1 Tax=Candidatus Amarolinea dominans TaxID=3140696 RepID=UPI003136D389|nr:hypothetical protein [Anaerolineae bacterium]
MKISEIRGKEKEVLVKIRVIRGKKTNKELVETVMAVSGKHVNVEWVKGPVGVQSRNFSNARIYPWIEEQVRATRGMSKNSN